MEQLDRGSEKNFNFRNVVIGLVIIFISTLVFVTRFGDYDTQNTLRQSIAIFFCVGFFTMGAMMVFASITFKNRMIYLVAPFVVILGTFFVMNFVHITGMGKIIDSYPKLQMAKQTAQSQLHNAEAVIKQLQGKNRELEAKYYLQKARIDFFEGKRLDTVITELKAAAEVYQKAEKPDMALKVNDMISNLEKLPPTFTQDFMALEELF